MNRVARTFSVLAFSSTHDALDAEALLLDLGIGVVPIPAPKVVGALCGIALRLEPSEADRAVRYLADAGVVVAGRGEVEDV